LVGMLIEWMNASMVYKLNNTNIINIHTFEVLMHAGSYIIKGTIMKPGSYR